MILFAVLFENWDVQVELHNPFKSLNAPSPVKIKVRFKKKNGKKQSQ